MLIALQKKDLLCEFVQFYVSLIEYLKKLENPEITQEVFLLLSLTERN